MGPGEKSFKNTIVSDNNSGGANCFSTLTSQGGNLDSGNSCGFSDPTDLVDTDPLLLGLAYNGGVTPTHALQKTSPAIDSGIDSGCPDTDQRGLARPYDGDTDGTATCDIGAFELSKKDLRSSWNLFLPAIIGNSN